MSNPSAVESMTTSQPGQFVVFEPTTRALELGAQAPAHRIGPSFLQIDHINSHVAKLAEGIPYRAFVIGVAEIPMELDVEALRRGLTSFVTEHDEMRCWFSCDENNSIIRHLADTEAVEFAVDDSDQLLNSEDLPDWIYREFGRRTVFQSFPAFAFAAIRREGSFTLLLGFDHAISDAGSACLAIYDVVQRYSVEVGAEIHIPPLPRGKSHLEYVADEYAAAAACTPDSEVTTTWRTILTDLDNRFPSVPFDLGLKPGQTAPGVTKVHRLLDNTDAEKLERACQSVDSRLSGAMFAALAIADYELAGRNRYASATVLSTRQGPYLTAQGWFCNFAPVAFKLGSASTFTELVPSAQKAFWRARDMRAVPVHAPLAHLIAAGQITPDIIRSPQMVSYLDFRVFPDGGVAAIRDSLATTGTARTANANIWLNRTDDGIVFIVMRPDTVEAEKSLADYTRRLGRILQSVADTGDYEFR